MSEDFDYYFEISSHLLIFFVGKIIQKYHLIIKSTSFGIVSSNVIVDSHDIIEQSCTNIEFIAFSSFQTPHPQNTPFSNQNTLS